MTTVFVVALALTANPPEDLDAFFARFAEKRAGIQILEADIHEESTLYGDVTQRDGSLIFGQPNRILFRYGEDDIAMLIDGRRVYEHDPEGEQVQIYDIDDSPEASVFFLGFDEDTTALREAYDVRLFAVQGGGGKHGISIRPFQEDMHQASFVEISIYLREDDFLPYRIEITRDDDSQIVTEFTNYRVNAPLDPARTQLQIPAGTRVIENGEVVIRAVPGGGTLMPPEPLQGGGSAPAVEAPPGDDQDAPAQEPAVRVEELPAP